MLKKIKKKYSQLSQPVKTASGVVLSALTGFTASLMLSLLFSFILSQSPEISGFLKMYFVISVLAGAFCCGFTGNKVLSLKGLASGLICSVLYLAFTISFMMIYSDGNISIYSAIMFIAVVFMSITGGIVSANMKRRK